MSAISSACSDWNANIPDPENKYKILSNLHEKNATHFCFINKTKKKKKKKRKKKEILSHVGCALKQCHDFKESDLFVATQNYWTTFVFSPLL